MSSLRRWKRRSASRSSAARANSSTEGGLRVAMNRVRLWSYYEYVRNTIITNTRGTFMPRHIILGLVLAAALLVPVGSSASAQEAPKGTSEPVVSGPKVQGETLRTTNGAWSGSTPMTFQYRWLRCDKSGGGTNGVNCDTIPGETRNSYALTSRDVGHTMRSRVIATNGDGSSSMNSDPTSVVQSSATAGPPSNSTPPMTSGTPQEKQTLTASQGTWTGRKPQTYTFQWRRCNTTGGSCADISGATKST